MPDDQKAVQLTEGQSCSQTLQNTAVTNLEQRQQGGVQTSQNIQQALAAIANSQQGQGTSKKS